MSRLTSRPAPSRFSRHGKYPVWRTSTVPATGVPFRVTNYVDEWTKSCTTGAELTHGGHLRGDSRVDSRVVFADSRPTRESAKATRESSCELIRDSRVDSRG